MNDEIEASPRPRLFAQGLLLHQRHVGGRPRQHSRPPGIAPARPNRRSRGRALQPEGAIPLCVPPGTSVIIDRRLWHSRSLNSWRETRKMLMMGYSYRWLLPKDDMTVEHLYPGLDPIRRQLLRNNRSNNSTYAPEKGEARCGNGSRSTAQPMPHGRRETAAASPTSRQCPGSRPPGEPTCRPPGPDVGNPAPKPEGDLDLPRRWGPTPMGAATCGCCGKASCTRTAGRSTRRFAMMLLRELPKATPSTSFSRISRRDRGRAVRVAPEFRPVYPALPQSRG